MREIRSSGSVEGVVSNRDPYSDTPQFFSCLSRAMAVMHLIETFPLDQADGVVAVSESFELLSLYAGRRADGGC